MELRKDTIRTPTQYKCAEGNMSRGDNASPYSVRRSRRPQTRLEDFIHENRGDLGDACDESQPQDGGRRLRPHGPRVRLRGVTQRYSTDESFEQRRSIVGGE